MQVTRLKLNSVRETFLVTGLLIAVAVLSACSSPQTKVAGQLDILRQAWEENVIYQAQLPNRTLDWPTAVQLMRENNLKLRQAATDVTNAHEAVIQIFKDLVPTLNLRAGVVKPLVDTPNLELDDVNFSASSFFNVPGVVN